jgi:general stress protein 26
MKNTTDEKVKNLSHDAAIKKIKELVKDAEICMFTTDLLQVPLTTRPMSAMETDEEGNLWFFSHKSSTKNKEIALNPYVQLFFSNKSSAEFLSIYGQAQLVYDRKKIEDLWNPLVKVWFQEGKNDPNITLIKVSPLHSYYWDTQHNKMMALIKMVTSVVSGATMDDGVEGTLHV